MHSANPFDNFMRKHLQYYSYYRDTSLNYELNNKKKDKEEEMESSCVNSKAEMVEAKAGDPSNKDTLLEKFKKGIHGTTQLVSTLAKGKMILKLQEPRDLHFMSQLMGAQSEPRWPRGLECKTSHIRHICIIPENPEPFYKQTGFEAMPRVRTNLTTNKVVFQNRRILNSDVMACEPESSDSNSENYTNFDLTELQFESRFESGNLARAVRVGTYDYELYLHCDLYTRSHTQWYYFKVTNTRKDVPYRFTIVNLTKSNSLYNCGMKPLMYSERCARHSIAPIGWQRIGYNIKYYKNNLNHEDPTQRKSSYSFTWTFNFPFHEDTVYFAHSYPYTYSDLQEYLFKCASDAKISKFFNIRILCRSLAGNNIYILTVTNPISDTVKMKIKKAVFVTCRVHPGESNASWVMKGFLDVLTSDSEYSNLLRDMFVFKIVPMLNPDGVVVGNYRCSLSGRDLNRNYKSTLEGRFPTIGNIITMVKKLLTKFEVVMYCDFHSHSRKHNSFFYGCKERNVKLFEEKIFPYLLAKNAPNHFLFRSCKFKVQRSRRRTSRVIMWKLGIKNSFTFEVSCCGSTIGEKKGLHFNTKDYELLGLLFLDTLLDYVNLDSYQIHCLFDEMKKICRKLPSKKEKRGLYEEDQQTSEEDEEEDEDGNLVESSDVSDSSESDDVSDEPLDEQVYEQKKISSDRKIEKHGIDSYSKLADSNRNKSRTAGELALEIRHHKDKYTKSADSNRSESLPRTQLALEFRQSDRELGLESSSRSYLEYLSKNCGKSSLNSSTIVPSKNHVIYFNSDDTSPGLNIVGMKLDEKSLQQNSLLHDILWSKIKATNPSKQIHNRTNKPRYFPSIFYQNEDEKQTDLQLFGSSLNKGTSRSFINSANRKYKNLHPSLTQSPFIKQNIPLSTDLTRTLTASKKTLYKKPFGH